MNDEQEKDFCQPLCIGVGDSSDYCTGRMATNIRDTALYIFIRTGVVMTANNPERPAQQRLSGVPVQTS